MHLPTPLLNAPEQLVDAGSRACWSLASFVSITAKCPGRKHQQGPTRRVPASKKSGRLGGIYDQLGPCAEVRSDCLTVTRTRYCDDRPLSAQAQRMGQPVVGRQQAH
jgi:hypothetical protein